MAQIKIKRGKEHVTSREGRVSRNGVDELSGYLDVVTSREGRVSRNFPLHTYRSGRLVTSREGRVSRNESIRISGPFSVSRPARGV